MAAYPYYRIRLAEYVAQLLPDGPCALLDVGAGDGALGAVIARYRPATRVIAAETFLRSTRSHSFPFVRFGGIELPFRTSAFDVAIVLNVLHHADDARGLMQEVRRVTRRRIIIKDHVANGWLDRQRLSVLDVLGNIGSGAVIKGRYASDSDWRTLFDGIHDVEVQRHDQLMFRQGLLGKMFGNHLEVMFRVDCR